MGFARREAGLGWGVKLCVVSVIGSVTHEKSMPGFASTTQNQYTHHHPNTTTTLSRSIDLTGNIFFPAHHFHQFLYLMLLGLANKPSLGERGGRGVCRSFSHTVHD